MKPGFVFSSAREKTKPGFLIQVEVAIGSGDWFGLRLLEGLLEPPRQRIAARLFRGERLLEQGLAPRRFRRQDPLGFAQLGLVRALVLAVRDDAAEIHVDDERGVTAGTRDL